MMGKRLAILIAMMALVVASCWGGTVETAAESNAVGTGIGVHGAWTITVLESDGSIASTTEFTNALEIGGRNLLSGVLMRFATIGNWIIDLVSVTAEPFCEDVIRCRIVESQSTIEGHSANLTVTTGDDPPHPLVLTGSVEVTHAGEIGLVETFNHACFPNASESAESTKSPEQCASDGGRHLFQFTGTELDPIPVAAGQRVQVEVEIEFGTLTTP